MRGEFYDFVETFEGLHWKKLKLGEITHVHGSLRKILKHQAGVDNNPWAFVPVSFLYISILFGIVTKIDF